MKKTRLIRQKTQAEVDFLEAQFQKDPSWSRKTVQYCKEVLNLGTTQIYKWGFDKKLAREKREKRKTTKRGRKSAKTRKANQIQKSKKARGRSKKCIEDADFTSKVLAVSSQVSQIDYNKEVRELVNLYNNQCKSDSN